MRQYSTTTGLLSEQETEEYIKQLFSNFRIFMARTTDPDEMDMPCPCNHCGNWFDLQDGQRSEKWYPGIVFCETCAQEEETEIELGEEIEELNLELEEAEWELNEATQAIYHIQKRLDELKGSH